MRTLARSAVHGPSLLVAALLAAPAAPAATVASFSFSGEPGSAPSYSFVAGGRELTVTGVRGAGEARAAAQVTRGPLGLGVLGRQGRATDLRTGGGRKALVFSFARAVRFGTLGFGGPDARGRIALYLDGRRYAHVPLGGAARLTYGFAGGASGRTLRVERPGPAGGFGVSSLTLVAPVPTTLPLLLSALAGLAFLRARGRRSMREGR